VAESAFDPGRPFRDVLALDWEEARARLSAAGVRVVRVLEAGGPEDGEVRLVRVRSADGGTGAGGAREVEVTLARFRSSPVGEGVPPQDPSPVGSPPTATPER
jgi:hypothetical protein